MRDPIYLKEVWQTREKQKLKREQKRPETKDTHVITL